ncbi:sucrase ferredoxin [Streptomyces xiamenensis]|uniref:sucrase ferredoxin n=1 Tax=Streptomyces xiamenensis TaxID=408015 RepID=UPI0036F0E991
MSMCATASWTREEPLAGTAATATTWLLLEQPGPWGPQALTGSRLDPVLGDALESAARGTGVRVALIRRPGRPSADAAADPSRRVYLAHTRPGHSWLRELRVQDPRRLLALDFTRLGAGEHDGTGDPYHGDPLALVCTNGRRDRCCALLGRPLAAELEAGGGVSAWEITHIGGHRFAPTLLMLPHGYAYGRASAPLIKEVATALGEGRVVTRHCRGRSAWDRPGQAAELAVRELTGEEGPDALTVEAGGTDGAAAAVTVRHTDGRRWAVTVDQAADSPALPASCGAAPQPQSRMTVTAVRPLP